MKKIILTAIISGLICGSIGVFAGSYNAKQISFTPEDNTWKVNTVGSALDDIKKNGTSKKICTKLDGESLAVGSKYECNPSLDGETKYNFYVLRVEGNAVKLIMERNITDEVGSNRTSDWKTAMNFFRNGTGKSLGWKTQVELPRAQDIADAVGNTGWKTAEKDYNGWFCLETNKQDTTTNPYCYNNTQKTEWLWNYTRECADWHCSNSLDSNYAYGYWTGDMVSKQLDTTAPAWNVGRSGNLGTDTVSDTASYGVRPVITISKSNIK